MKNDKINYLLCLLFFVILAAITFRCAFGADNVFSASDVNMGGLAHRKNVGIDLFLGFYRSHPVLGATNHSYSLFNLLVALIPLHLFSDLFYGAILITGSLSLVWFLRLWKRGWFASVFGALVGFWFNSIMLAAGGHVYKMEVLVFSVLALCLIEKAIRAASIKQSVGFSMLAGLSVGIMMIEQQDVALLAGLFIAPYALFRLLQEHAKSLSRWLGLLLPLGGVALFLSGSTVLKSYRDNISNAAPVQGTDDQKWNFVTQWSLVPDEWPDLVAPGWSGWSSNNPEGPYWGRLGQSAEWEASKQGFRNFKLTSNYLGIIPFLLAGYGFWVGLRSRKEGEGALILFFSVIGLLGLWLAFGKYSILYKLFYQLPVVGNIRAPIKLLDNFQIILGIVAAYGLDRLLVDGKDGKSAKVLWISGAALSGMMLLAGLKVMAFPASWKSDFAGMGFAAHSAVMLSLMANAWFHAAIFSLLGATLVFLIWKGVKHVKWAAAAFVIALAADSLILTSHYFRADDISALRKGNSIMDFLKENQRDERVFFLDQGGIYNRWLAIDSSYHGLNIFNIWQMPRMPPEYKEFLGVVGRNQIRLWELSSVKYIAAPASIQEQFKKNPELRELFVPVLNYQVPTAQGMRQDVLLEFKGCIPRFSLIQGWDVQPLEKHCSILASPGHNPHMTVLLEPSANILPRMVGGVNLPAESTILTKKDATVEVNTAGPSILRFSQRYQPGWRVFVDGKEASLLKVDFLCMGVEVPPGKHAIEFKCPRTKQPLFMTAVFLLSLLGATVLVRRRRDN